MRRLSPLRGYLIMRSFLFTGAIAPAYELSPPIGGSCLIYRTLINIILASALIFYVSYVLLSKKIFGRISEADAEHGRHIGDCVAKVAFAGKIEARLDVALQTGKVALVVEGKGEVAAEFQRAAII